MNKLELFTLIIAFFGALAWTSPFIYEKIKAPKLLVKLLWVLPLRNFTLLNYNNEPISSMNLILLKFNLTSVNRGFDIKLTEVGIYTKSRFLSNIETISLPIDGIHFEDSLPEIGGSTLIIPEYENLNNINYLKLEETIHAYSALYTSINIEEIEKIEIKFIRYNGKKHMYKLNLKEYLIEKQNEKYHKSSVEERYFIRSKLNNQSDNQVSKSP